MAIDAERFRALADLRARIDALDLSDHEMWLNCLRCGGSGDLLSFQAYVHGALELSGSDWTALCHSVWEAENL